MRWIPPRMEEEPRLPSVTVQDTRCDRGRKIRLGFRFRSGKISRSAPRREERPEEREQLLGVLRALARVLVEHAEDEAVAGLRDPRVPGARHGGGLAEVLLHDV